MVEGDNEASEDTSLRASNRGRSPWPALGLGVALLVGTAALLTWRTPASPREAPGGSSTARTSPGRPPSDDRGGPRRAGPGGVAPRTMDDARRTRAASSAPAVAPNTLRKLSPGAVTLAAPSPMTDSATPSFDSRREAIAWYEGRLHAALEEREARRRFKERLPRIRQRIERGENPHAQLATFEERARIVEANYDRAQAEVEAVEERLASLRRATPSSLP